MGLHTRNDNNKYTGGNNLANKLLVKSLHNHGYPSAAYDIAWKNTLHKQQNNFKNLMGQQRVNFAKMRMLQAEQQKNLAEYRSMIYSGNQGAAGTAYNYANGYPSSTSATSAQNSFDPSLYMQIWREMSEKNNELNIQMNRENNQFTADEAEKQRAWEQNMSNTAHQREVSDLTAAGLNPILSSGGTGAVTPSGASASASNWTGADNSYIHALAELAATSMSSNAAITAASLNSSATMQAAAMSAQANMYSADQSRISSMYGSDKSYASSIYGTDKGYQSSIYRTDKGYTAAQTANIINGVSGLLNFMSNFFPTKVLKGTL